MEIIFSEESRNDSDVLEVFGIYFETSFKHFTIEEQADNLCYNLSDLVHALRVIIEKTIPVNDK